MVYNWLIEETTFTHLLLAFSCQIQRIYEVKPSLLIYDWGDRKENIYEMCGEHHTVERGKCFGMWY